MATLFTTCARRCPLTRCKMLIIITMVATNAIVWMMFSGNGPYEYAEYVHQAKKSRAMVTESYVDWNCSKQLAILTPHTGPFKAWREYVMLKPLFASGADDTNAGNTNEVPQFQLRCRRYNCTVNIGATLTDREFLQKSDGVVINMAPNLLKNNLLATIDKLNNILTSGTKWLLWGMESPQMFMYWDPNISNITYHKAITYHSQSDIVIPYGFFVDNEPMDTFRRNWASGKTKTIAWMASNCENTFWPRLDFVHELQEYIPIDMYGKCGNLTCLPPMSPECNSNLEQYKFYLALENAECDEYISEKFWESCLNHGIVPVVYGGRQSAYEKLAPPNSFIHVGNFETAKELAEFLLMLDQNDDKYNKYFEWRLAGHVVTNYPPLDPASFCETIPLLQDQQFNAKNVLQESQYFNSCRGDASGTFAEAGSLSSWSPWS